MKTLDDIALGYKTDKSSMWHNYTKLYALYFDPIRNEKLKILEIGVDKGYSVKAWKEYFPNAEITAIDIIDLKHLEEERVNIITGSQNDVNFLGQVNKDYGPFDIIIDDGSHHNDDMKCSFEYLFPLLKKGGLYIVEDLHACYWGKSHGTGEPVFIDLLKKLIDGVNSGGKSGTANIALDDEDGWYHQKKLAPMDWWEKNLEFIHLYRSIVFIKKYPPSEKDLYIEGHFPNYLTVGKTVPLKYYESYLKRKVKKIYRKIKYFLKKI
ncbi:class I SAM-dependent methyltransferase [Candidatus Nomurabacteria bacterium]|nr:class I SAM-dependent methyltransferase [Candidatus Nomurabacteria bacterium]